MIKKVISSKYSLKTLFCWINIKYYWFVWVFILKSCLTIG